MIEFRASLTRYYETLGLPLTDLDYQTINARYRSLAKQYHPDKGNGNLEIMQQINRAYSEILKKG
ncbi:MAG: J domain-containing protein [Candidatus Tectomicrobia bacterium]|nr:J domain-containing protein [Candidatus Tectomicrobia bacterium]